MSSDTSRRPRRRSPAALLLLVAAALVLPSCGHKKPPIPPPRIVPARVASIEVGQRGTEAVLSFPYPSTTASGVGLPGGITRVDLYQATREVPQDILDMVEEEEMRRKVLEEELEEQRAAEAAERAALYAVPGATPESAAEPEPGTEGESTESQEPAESTVAPPPEEPAAETVPDSMAGEAEAVDQGASEEMGEAMGEGAEDEAAGETMEGETAEGEEEEEDPAALLARPATKREDFAQMDPRTFDKEASLVQSIEGDELSGAVLGDRIFLRVPLAAAPETGATAHIWGVTTYSERGIESEMSSLAVLVPGEPPPPPTELTITPQPRGIDLTWAAETDPEEGFRIYRRDVQARIYDRAIAVLAGDVRSYTDLLATMGGRYIYAVTAAERATPLVESALSSEHEIHYLDRFPPAAPASLVGFPEPDRVRLIWEASTDDDVAGYLVYRRMPGGEGALLTLTPVKASEYLDSDVTTGETWIYTVVAVDGNDNRSEASDELEIRIP